MTSKICHLIDYDISHDDTRDFSQLPYSHKPFYDGGIKQNISKG